LPAAAQSPVGSASSPLSEAEVSERIADLAQRQAGRGGTGKTLLIRWICERALRAGRSVVIADGDRTNRSLPLFLDGVLSPPSADDQTMWRWLESILERMVVERFPLLLDLGGGDLVLRQMALELGLHDLLVRQDLTPVVLHLLSPEVESLSCLASLEENSLFAPERTALILNAGLVPRGPASDAAAFERVREHKVFKAAIRRGAMPIVMPRLIPAHEITARHLSFADAAGHRPGPRSGSGAAGPAVRAATAAPVPGPPAPRTGAADQPARSPSLRAARRPHGVPARLRRPLPPAGTTPGRRPR
jgi:hypothetical protein